jgi:predicted MFS family arabinose efflux permease
MLSHQHVEKVGDRNGAKKENDRHLYLDVLYWGILGGSVLSFLGIYLARIGADPYELGVLTAGPALINLLLSLPVGKWLETKSFVRISYLSSMVHRFGYVVILAVMLIFAERLQISLILVISLIMSIPGAILMIAFNAMFAEIVPPERRGVVVGRRNALLAISMTTTALGCGQLLEHLPFPLNYQIVFGFGILGAGMSSFELGQIRPLPGHNATKRIGKPLLDRARPGVVGLPFGRRYFPGMRFFTRRGDILRVDLLKGEFLRFLGAMLFFYIAQNLVIPLFPTYYVETMGLSDRMISLGTAFFQVCVFFTSMQLGKASKRIGYHRLIVISAFGYAIFPLSIGIWPVGLSYMIGATGSGIVWGFLSGAMVNRLMERCPEDDLPAHMALNNLTLSLGIMIGSFSGPILGNITGMQEAILIGAVLRMLSAGLLLRWG